LQILARAAPAASSRLVAAEDRHSAFVFVLSAALGRFVEHSQRVPANEVVLYKPKTVEKVHFSKSVN
jgi:hypothetical protein